jgi:O-acetylhomoserine/O-acetylserine sulfhydrylase-like pyridoxal-dependent enzyme
MISQGLTTSFKQQLFLAIQNFTTDTFKIALYTANADLGADTTVYTTTAEITGTGYTAGGLVLTGTTVSVSGTTAFVDFADAVWNPANFLCRGALIYNASKSNAAVAVLDFGADKVPTTTFTVQMPANNSTSALIRLP